MIEIKCKSIDKRRYSLLVQAGRPDHRSESTHSPTHSLSVCVCVYPIPDRPTERPTELAQHPCHRSFVPPVPSCSHYPSLLPIDLSNILFENFLIFIYKSIFYLFVKVSSNSMLKAY